MIGLPQLSANKGILNEYLKYYENVTFFKISNKFSCHAKKLICQILCASVLRLTMSSKCVKAKQQLTFISVSVVIGCHIYYYLCIQQDVTIQIHSFGIGIFWYKLISVDIGIKH